MLVSPVNSATARPGGDTGMLSMVRYPSQRLVVCKDGEGPALKNKPKVSDALQARSQLTVKEALLGLVCFQLAREEIKRMQ